MNWIEGHNSFVDFYVYYHSMRTAASVEYAKHLIINTIGHAFGRNTVHLIQPGAVRHNMYTALIGESSSTMKTTAQEEVLGDVDSKKKLLSKEFSPEGLLKELEDDSSKKLHMGEWSKLLRAMNHGGHMAKFREMSNEFLSCPELYVKKLVNKEYTVENVYFSQTTTATPIQLRENLSSEDVEGGYAPRFILVFGKPSYRKRGPINSEVMNIQPVIADIIQRTYDFFENANVEFTCDKEALEQFNVIDKYLRTDKKFESIAAYAARYTNYIIAYADILFWCDFIAAIGDHLYTRGKFKGLTDLLLLLIDINLTLLTNDNSESNNDGNGESNIERESFLAKVNSVSTLGSLVKNVKIVETGNILIGLRDKSVEEEKKIEITINKEYIDRAWELFKGPIDYVSEIVDYIMNDKNVARVRQQIEKFAPIERKWLSRYAKVGKKKLDEAIDNEGEEGGDHKTVEVDNSPPILTFIKPRYNTFTFFDRIRFYLGSFNIDKTVIIGPIGGITVQVVAFDPHHDDGINDSSMIFRWGDDYGTMPFSHISACFEYDWDVFRIGKYAISAEGCDWAGNKGFGTPKSFEVFYFNI